MKTRKRMSPTLRRQLIAAVETNHAAVIDLATKTGIDCPTLYHLYRHTREGKARIKNSPRIP